MPRILFLILSLFIGFSSPFDCGTPIDCGFESSFCNFSSTNSNWFRATTTSEPIGPSGPNSGSYYAYSNSGIDDELISEEIDGFYGVVSFYYQMYGSATLGTLSMSAYNAGIWTQLFYQNGNQGSGWKAASYGIAGNFTLIKFSVTHESGTSTDIAIDDVVVELSSCSPSLLPSPSPTLSPSFAPSVHPTLSSLPSGLPTVFPSPPPTSTPTFPPSPLPTMPPSLLPSTVPTMLPTPIPTNSPTPAPTVYPSPLPTALPSMSPRPTSIPTPPPTPGPSRPTLEPSPIPTSVPTMYCEPGEIFVDSVCESCPIGKFTNTSSISAPFPTECTLCPSGSYASSTGNYECSSCAIGKLSNPSRTACQDCEAGQYSFNALECVSCEAGKYAPRALSDSCIQCSAGYRTNNITGSTLCTACDAGTFSTSATVVCGDCGVGKYSAGVATTCINCAVGTYNNETGSATCLECAAGTYTNITGSTSCLDCDIGTFQPATSQNGCVKCSRGKYQSNVGSLSCFTCRFGYYSIIGAESCEIADEKYYLLSSAPNASIKVKACPKNAYCAGGLYAPAPLEGYWSDRSSYANVGDVYECPRDTCKGYKNALTPGANFSCWHQRAYLFYDAETDTQFHRVHHGTMECDESEVLCFTGASGRLCGSCKFGYIFRGETRRCEPCEAAKGKTFIVVGIGVFFTLVALTMLVGWKYVPWFRRQSVFRFLAHIDTGSIKVVWVTYQIIASTSFNLDITYPSPFQDMLGVFNFFSLDFLALECFQDAKDRYFTSVILWSTFPMGFAFLIFAFYLIRIKILNYITVSEEYILERAHTIKVQHVWMFLLLTYLVLPPVTMKQLQSLDCIPFPHDASSYLRVDTIIDCKGTDYLEFQGYVIFFIIIYQLIPILWLWLLYRKIHSLMPAVTKTDVRLALYIRDKDPKLAPIRFLFDSYNVDRWWFEVAEMYRRVVFVSVIPLTSNVKATRASLGCVLAIMSILYYREENPFRREFTNVIAYVAQAAIFITYYAALSIETGVMVDFGLNDIGMGIFLVLVNISVFGLLVHISIRRMRAEQKRNALKHAHANGLEYAVGFSAEKFETTLDAVVQTVVPASHTLVFHYTTAFGARRALKSGIPAHKQVGGVLVTDKRPFDLGHYDEIFFTKYASFAHSTANEKMASLTAKDSNNDENNSSPFVFEAVLAVALPSRILHSIKPHKFDTSKEEDEQNYHSIGNKGVGLYYVPSELLNALRPISFTTVIEPAPWADGLILLPPTPIVRGYQLSKDITTNLGLSNHHHDYHGGANGGGIKKEKWLGKDFAQETVHHVALNQRRQDSFLEFASPPLGLSLDDKPKPTTAISSDDSTPLLTTTNSSSSSTTTTQKNEKKIVSQETSKSTDNLKNSDHSKDSTKTINTSQTPAQLTTSNSSGGGEDLSHSSSELDKGDLEKGGDVVIESMRTPFIAPTLRQAVMMFKGHGTIAPKVIVVETPATLTDYMARMRTIRRRCAATGKVPLYHYTQTALASMILKTGLRMSRQGQGDGGVYFSTLGPCSYGLGLARDGSLDNYEENIIKDCFGVERLQEYKGQGKLDVVIVYGITPLALQPAPGGRDNAKVVTKGFFHDLSLPQSDGNFFLDPGAIMGAFVISPTNPPAINALTKDVRAEVMNDNAIKDYLGDAVSDIMSYIKRPEPSLNNNVGGGGRSKIRKFLSRRMSSNTISSNQSFTGPAYRKQASNMNDKKDINFSKNILKKNQQLLQQKKRSGNVPQPIVTSSRSIPVRRVAEDKEESKNIELTPSKPSGLFPGSRSPRPMSKFMSFSSSSSSSSSSSQVRGGSVSSLSANTNLTSIKESTSNPKTPPSKTTASMIGKKNSTKTKALPSLSSSNSKKKSKKASSSLSGFNMKFPTLPSSSSFVFKSSTSKTLSETSNSSSKTINKSLVKNEKKKMKKIIPPPKVKGNTIDKKNLPTSKIPPKKKKSYFSSLPSSTTMFKNSNKKKTQNIVNSATTTTTTTNIKPKIKLEKPNVKLPSKTVTKKKSFTSHLPSIPSSKNLKISKISTSSSKKTKLVNPSMKVPPPKVQKKSKIPAVIPPTSKQSSTVDSSKLPTIKPKTTFPSFPSSKIAVPKLPSLPSAPAFTKKEPAVDLKPKVKLPAPKVKVKPTKVK